MEDYKNEFGYLGPFLHSLVVRAPKIATPTVTSKAAVTVSQVGCTLNIKL